MEKKRKPLTHILRPILDTYRNSALALVGCHSVDLQRASCEYDLLVITNERLPPSSIRIGDASLDLVFLEEREVLTPSDPEHAVSLAHAIPLRDTSLVLSTSIASNAAVVAEASTRSARTRLATALKGMGRVDQALSESSAIDADFWLLSASYDFACAWLLSREVSPAPSHLLQQLTEQSKGAARNFEAFSKGAGLRKSTRSTCALRLDALRVVYDVLERREGGGGGQGSNWSGARALVVSGKAAELVASVELAECYSYLGQEALLALSALAAREARAGGRPSGLSTPISSLTRVGERQLSRRLFEDLGFSRGKQEIEEGLQLLRNQASRLAKGV